jgi:hypothetical protein
MTRYHHPFELTHVDYRTVMHSICLMQFLAPGRSVVRLSPTGEMQKDYVMYRFE